MKENFAKAVDFTLSWEGGDSYDAWGGVTRFGIAQRYHPGVDIANLTRDQAKDIYRSEYWLPVGADFLPWPLDLVAFDTAVNLGTKRVWAWLKESHDWEHVLLKRCLYYAEKAKESVPKRKYLLGWLIRCGALEELARRGLCDG